VFAFARIGHDARKPLVFVANLTPVPRTGYRVGLPVPGRWRELVNTDADVYGGSGTGNYGAVEAEDVPWMDQYHSAELALPPLGALWLVPDDEG
jgi:1,4-alpha-glucan branching enzyme